VVIIRFILGQALGNTKLRDNGVPMVAILIANSKNDRKTGLSLKALLRTCCGRMAPKEKQPYQIRGDDIV
jgi:hypothetical protein